MKTILFCLFIFWTLHFQAQQVSKLLGAHSNGTTNVFSAINLSGNTYQGISVLNNSLNLISGITTFDDAGSRYFIKTDTKIFVINALTGNLYDSIVNIGSFNNIEYDRGANSLVGMAMTGTAVVFKTYDLTTKIATVKSTLISVDSIVIGESTFDPTGRKYFAMTNLGMVVIDSNGILVNVLCASPHLKGIEYNPINNRIYYLEWNGSDHNFVSIDATTCNIGVLGSFNGLTTVLQGETTFDKQLGHYFNRTSLGLLQIDTQTGLIMDTLQATNNFAGFEFARLPVTGFRERHEESGISVYPNPSSYQFNFINLVIGDKLEVMNVSGHTIFQTILNEKSMTLTFKDEIKGVYFYRITHISEVIQSGKLILK